MPTNPENYTQPTPGPWYVNEIDGGVYAGTNLITQDIKAYNIRHNGYENPKRMQAYDDGGNANARLIAAAPELLAALKWYVENDDTNIGQEGNEFWEEGLAAGKAAIAKATQ